jgi:hypothetical protein
MLRAGVQSESRADVSATGELMDPNAQVPPPPPPPAPEGWYAPQAPASAGSPIIKILVAVAAIILIGGGIFAFRALTDGPAKIVFTTTDPPAGSTCDEIGDLVDSVSAGTDVWMVINFKSTMDDRIIDVTVTKDGEDYDTFYYDDLSGWDCISEVESFADLEPGTYKFTATIDDKVEAEGTLVVK